MPRLFVPQFNRSAPHCQLIGNARRRRPVLSAALKPLDHLDAAHFFSSGSTAEPSPTPHVVGGAGSPRLPAVVGGGNVAEEYRLLASATRGAAAPAGARRPHAGGYLELLDLDALRIVFLLLDAMLLLYRITNVYVGGLVVSRRFDDEPATIAGGRWATASPRKTGSGRLAAAVRAPPSPTGAANYVDASEYLQPVELRVAEPPASPE